MSQLSLVSNLSSPPLSSSSWSWDKSGNISWGHWSSSLSLSNMMSQLSLMSNLSSPPLSSCSGSWNKTGNISWGYWSSSLSLSHMMSQLSLVSNLSSPPLSSSSWSWNKTGNVSRGHWSGSLSLWNMMCQLSLVNKLSSPPLSSSSWSWDKSRNVSWGHWSSSLSLASLSNSNMMNITVGEVGTWNPLSQSSMVDITERIVSTRQFIWVWDWSLRPTSWSTQGACLVDFVIFSKKSIVTVRVGRTQGLQVIWELSSSKAG